MSDSSNAARAETLESPSLYRANVLVCHGTSCTASGSPPLIEDLRAEVARRGLESEVRIVETGCRGFCAMGPVMIVYPEGIFYCQVQASDVKDLVEETLVKGRVLQRLTYREPATHQAVPFYEQIRSTASNFAWCCATAVSSIRRASRSTSRVAVTRR